MWRYYSDATRAPMLIIASALIVPVAGVALPPSTAFANVLLHTGTALSAVFTLVAAGALRMQLSAAGPENAAGWPAETLAALFSVALQFGLIAFLRLAAPHAAAEQALAHLANAQFERSKRQSYSDYYEAQAEKSYKLYGEGDDASLLTESTFAV